MEVANWPDSHVREREEGVIRHRAIGRMSVLIVVFPKFDPDDEEAIREVIVEEGLAEVPPRSCLSFGGQRAQMGGKGSGDIMTSPILFLDAALAGMALTAGAISGLLVCVQRQWRPLGWFALISLLAAVYASLGALRGPGADVEAFVDMTRWQTLCSYLCAIFLIRLYDDLCGRVPGWPEGLLTAGYLVLVVAGTVRTMPIPWDSVEALGPVELGRWGSVYVPRVQVSRFMVPVRIFHVLALGYCAWMAWTARAFTASQGHGIDVASTADDRLSDSPRRQRRRVGPVRSIFCSGDLMPIWALPSSCNNRNSGATSPTASGLSWLLGTGCDSSS